MQDRLSWAEVDLSALGRNIRALKSLLPPHTMLCAVVKADAYGHGAIPVAREALRSGADRLAVATAEEALVLREASIFAPVLVLGAVPESLLPDLLARDIRLTMFSPESALAYSRAARRAGKAVTVHAQIDTGMSRLGFQHDSGAEALHDALRLPGIALEGLYSHFARADEADPDITALQLARFLEAVRRLEKSGHTVGIRHIANSAATIRFPETRLDMVRTGIAIYGLWPSPDTERRIRLTPVMSFRTRLIQVRRIPAGTSVSYGGTWIAGRESLIGTIPVGYADGWPRALARGSEVLIGARRVPVVGRICMDQTMLDLTNCPEVAVGDEVTLFGPEGIDADEVAARMGTINYETVCMVGKRVPRVYPAGSGGEP